MKGFGVVKINQNPSPQIPYESLYQTRGTGLKIHYLCKTKLIRATVLKNPVVELILLYAKCEIVKRAKDQGT